MWCPVSLDFYPPPRGLNPAQPYYPGDQYVDWIGADGYDWAPHKPGAEWESFQELFQDAYNFDFVPEADNNNTPHNKPQWTRPILPDMTAENIIWRSFEGDAAPHEFDPNRYANWRFFWDYSGGNVYENMCHQLSFWYKVMKLQIPKTVNMVGGIYLWKDGREVPDTMNVAMEHPEEILFSWDSGFGNNQLGSTEDVLGTDGTISKGQQIRYVPQKINRPEGNEMIGTTRTGPNAHMQNFLDCIRSGKETNCPFDVGFRVSIACRMSVDSYRQGRAMHWDSAAEEIV